MQNLTREGLRIATHAAKRHGASFDAALTFRGAIVRGNGQQAQFDNPDLGGMRQWSQGGMIMVGDMFNQGLKYRVDALCNELAGLQRGHYPVKREVGRFQSQSRSGVGELAIRQSWQVRVYDAGEHRISGFSQQQGGDKSLTFTSQFGLVRVADLTLVFLHGDQPKDPPPSACRPSQAPGSPPRAA
jgi:hypothetical protein